MTRFARWLTTLFRACQLRDALDEIETIARRPATPGVTFDKSDMIAALRRIHAIAVTRGV